LKNLFPVLIISIIAFSCNKKDNGNGGPSCSASTSSLATTWKVTAIKYKQSPSSPEQDYYPMIYSHACEYDNVYVFNSNGNYTYEDRGTQCFPPDNFGGTWSVSGGILTIDGTPATIQDFNCTSFKLVTNNVFTAGDIFTATWVKQ
jgi:hypothetical protein